MSESDSTLPLLRLMQITESSFPVGGYAYSHGLEWLTFERRVVDEATLAELLRTFVAQTVRRQWLPAAAAAFRAKSIVQVLRTDSHFDASISAAAERDSGRAMGMRLLEVSVAAFTDCSTGFLEEVTARRTPGQFAVAFGALAREFAVREPDTLAALGFSLVSSVTQAAVRLGTIGPAAAARLIANSAPTLADAVQAVSIMRRPTFGAFAPGLELAAMLQPTLRFRMFAS
ncbi:MAG: urease accessory UreF family protein [bacterium]